jgi:hypothetical protein
VITYPFAEDGIEQALTALGTTPNAVATNLSAMGFRGCRDQESNCPVANYLLASVSDMASVSVFVEELPDGYSSSAGGHAECFDLTPDRQQPLFVIELPRPVVDFVLTFDRGDYPDLITEAVR